jgi:hypothetical protein
MLRLTTMALGEDAIIASLRAPNQHYLSSGPLGTPVPGSEIGYNWGTNRHSELNIALHHQIVQKVSGELRQRFDITRRRLILMGFSQPVGLNYRFIGTHPDAAGGVIAMCGGVPKDWEADKYSAYRPVRGRVFPRGRRERVSGAATGARRERRVSYASGKAPVSVEGVRHSARVFGEDPGCVKWHFLSVRTLTERC